MASKPKIVESSEKLKDSADRRTELAADRTIFAAERTYAAWVRTGLVAMASGTGAKALLMDTLPYWLITATGSGGVAASLSGGSPPPVPDAARMHPALLVFVNVVLALTSIAALIGIWFS